MGTPFSRSILFIGAIGLAMGGAVSAQIMDPNVMKGMTGPGGWGHSVTTNMARLHQVLMYGIPSPYTELRNPLSDQPEQVKAGAAVFQQHCASCHGFSGQGNGPAANNAVPPPANLAWLMHTPMSRSDPYVYWTIAEGGEQFASEMPAFKNTLSKTQIWQVISFIRKGLPERPRGG
jgi:mono/diheme cytochrome c family protein